MSLFLGSIAPFLGSTVAPLQWILELQSRFSRLFLWSPEPALPSLAWAYFFNPWLLLTLP